MDMTLVDSSMAKQYGRNYKEVQKHISEFSIFEGIRDVIEQLSGQHIIYVVSGNVGSTIKKSFSTLISTFRWEMFMGIGMVIQWRS